MISDKVYLNKIGFLVNDKYRLELKWKKVVYDKGVCYLKGAYFTGPVVKDLMEVRNNDFILLDFFKQYYMYAADIYIVELHWGIVNHELANNKINVSNVYLKHPTELNNVPKLRNKDYILINTEGHEAETHMFYPTYKAVVLNEFGEAYNFWNVDGEFRKV